MRAASSLVLAVFTLVMVSVGFTQQASVTTVPNLVRYGGTLRDAQGAPLSSSTVGATFAIYKQQDGGAPVWMETQTVTSDASGNYSVLLGATTTAGLPADLFSEQEQRWLGVQVEGQAEQPRVLLVSVPYAFKAHEAETLGGLPASAFVEAASSQSSSGSTTGTAVNAFSTAGNASGTGSFGTTSLLPRRHALRPSPDTFPIGTRNPRYATPPSFSRAATSASGRSHPDLRWL